MRIALIGSVSSSWYALDALIRSGVEMACVAGLDESRRGQVSDYRCLRELAASAGIPYLSFIRVSEPAVDAFLRQHRPDQIWVIGLSQLVPKEMLAISPAGGVGFHPTMLPEGRGRAPVAWTILRQARAAANLFYLTDEPDAGDIIIQREVEVRPDDYSADLIERTNLVLAEAIEELAPAIRSGRLPRTPQDHAKATYYPKRTAEDGLIDWRESTEDIYRLIRAAGHPYPGAFTFVDGHKLMVWRAQPVACEERWRHSRPGTIVEFNRDGLPIIATGDGAIEVTEVQWDVEGGHRRAFRAGDCLG